MPKKSHQSADLSKILDIGSLTLEDASSDPNSSSSSLASIPSRTAPAWDDIGEPFFTKQQFYMPLPFHLVNAADIDAIDAELAVYNSLRKYKDPARAGKKADVSSIEEECMREKAVLGHFCWRYCLWYNDLFTSQVLRERYGRNEKEEELGDLLVQIVAKKGINLKEYLKSPDLVFDPNVKEECELGDVIMRYVPRGEDPGFLESEATFKKYPELRQYGRGGELADLVVPRDYMIMHIERQLMKHYAKQPGYLKVQDVHAQAKKEAEAFQSLKVYVWRARRKVRSEQLVKEKRKETKDSLEAKLKPHRSRNKWIGQSWDIEAEDTTETDSESE